MPAATQPPAPGPSQWATQACTHRFMVVFQFVNGMQNVMVVLSQANWCCYRLSIAAATSCYSWQLPFGLLLLHCQPAATQVIHVALVHHHTCMPLLQLVLDAPSPARRPTLMPQTHGLLMPTETCNMYLNPMPCQIRLTAGCTQGHTSTVPLTQY
jgi:hypothetical protein